MRCIKTLKITSIISILLILSIICSCSPNTYYSKSDLQKYSVSDILFMQNSTDKGFHEITNAYSNLYMTLNGSYYTLSAMKRYHEIPNELKIKMIDLLDNLKYKPKDNNNYDDMNIIYYIFGLAAMADYKIPSNYKNQLVYYVSKLQNADGFFYRSSKEKEDYEGGKLVYKENDPIVLSTLYEAISILRNDKEKLDTNQLLSFLNNALKKININVFSIQDLAVISICIEISQILNINISSLDRLDLNAYANMCITSIKGNKDINIATIKDVSILLNKLGILNNSTIKSLVENYYNKNAYSYQISGNQSNIVAVDIALEIYELMNEKMPSGNITMITKYFNENQNYDMTYYYSNKPSTTISIYYAYYLLSSMKSNKYLEISKYVQNKVKNDLFSNPTSEILMLLQLALELNINIPRNDINNFFSDQYQIAKKANLNANRELIHLLIQTSNKYKYTVDPNIGKIIQDEINSNQQSIKSTPSMVHIVNECIDNEMLYYLDKPVSKDYLKTLFDYYNSNYNNLGDKLFATKWIVSVMELYSVGNEAISEVNKNNLHAEIKSKTCQRFYTYSTLQNPSFESVYGISRIVNFIS